MFSVGEKGEPEQGVWVAVLMRVILKRLPESINTERSEKVQGWNIRGNHCRQEGQHDGRRDPRSLLRHQGGGGARGREQVGAWRAAGWLSAKLPELLGLPKGFGFYPKCNRKTVGHYFTKCGPLTKFTNSINNTWETVRMRVLQSQPRPAVLTTGPVACVCRSAKAHADTHWIWRTVTQADAMGKKVIIRFSYFYDMGERILTLVM